MQNNKGLLAGVAFISLALGAGGGYYAGLQKQKNVNPDLTSNIDTSHSPTEEIEPPEGIYEEAPQEVTAATEPGFELAAATTQNPVFNFSFGQITIKAISDEVAIQSIEINRGNCTTDDVSKKRLPATLKFGQSTIINSNAGCDVTEVVVAASTGSWTFSFK